MPQIALVSLTQGETFAAFARPETSRILMMKLNHLASGLAVTAIAFGAAMGMEQPAAAQSVTFFCGSDGVNPVTYAGTARGNVPIVRWQSHYFSGSGYTPQQRCQEVSGRFQTYYNNGTLNYITTGIMNSQPVVCTSSTNGGGCSGLLFTLRPNDNASQVVQQLFNVRAGAAGPINQSASRVYVDINDLLTNGAVEGSTSATPIEATPAVSTPSTTQPATPPAPSPSGGSIW